MSDFYSIQQDAYPSVSEVDEMCAQPKKCEHKHTEQAEYYYGTLETDFYYYWICLRLTTKTLASFYISWI